MHCDTHTTLKLTSAINRDITNMASITRDIHLNFIGTLTRTINTIIARSRPRTRSHETILNDRRYPYDYYYEWLIIVAFTLMCTINSTRTINITRDNTSSTHITCTVTIIIVHSILESFLFSNMNDASNSNVTTTITIHTNRTTSIV